jgi:hypothetical protein
LTQQFIYHDFADKYGWNLLEIVCGHLVLTERKFECQRSGYTDTASAESPEKEAVTFPLQKQFGKTLDSPFEGRKLRISPRPGSGSSGLNVGDLPPLPLIQPILFLGPIVFLGSAKVRPAKRAASCEGAADEAGSDFFDSFCCAASKSPCRARCFTATEFNRRVFASRFFAFLLLDFSVLRWEA